MYHRAKTTEQLRCRPTPPFSHCVGPHQASAHASLNFTSNRIAHANPCSITSQRSKRLLWHKLGRLRANKPITGKQTTAGRGSYAAPLRVLARRVRDEPSAKSSGQAPFKHVGCRQTSHGPLHGRLPSAVGCTFGAPSEAHDATCSLWKADTTSHQWGAHSIRQ